MLFEKKLIDDESNFMKLIEPFAQRRIQTFFSPIVLSFLEKLSILIMEDRNAKNFPDVITYGFWIRKSNLSEMKNYYDSDEIRVGRGVALHIAPANVPSLFAYSLTLSLLAGNSNIVKLSSKLFPQVDFLIVKIMQCLELSEFRMLQNMICFVRFDNESSLTEKLSKLSDVRLIWGGDETVSNIRKYPIKVNGVELSFVDRYGACVIDTQALLNLDDFELSDLVRKFYNDTYLYDQNACSSPRLIVWLGSKSADEAKSRFWSSLGNLVSSKYEYAPSLAMKRLNNLCHIAAVNEGQMRLIGESGDPAYRIHFLDQASGFPDCSKLNLGMFVEMEIKSLEELQVIDSEKLQTCTYFGVSKNSFLEFLSNAKLSGFDRIVPIGDALEMAPVWDGHDLPRFLSRAITVKG